MEKTQFKILNAEQLDEAFPLLKELRPHLTLEEFRAIYDKAHTQNNYQFLGAVVGSQIIAIAGFRILYDYVHGKHLYVDDLVVTSSCRNQGIGAKLLKGIESMAKEQNVAGLRLCTGIEMEEAKRFYERQGWQARAIAFKKRLPEEVS